MPAPRGLGGWVAFQSAAHPDAVRSHDLETIIDRAKRLGCSWLSVRAGAGTGPDADLRDDSIAAYHAAGVKVFAWIFDYAGNRVGELAAWKRWVGKVDGAILNAEFEYIPESPVEARALVQGIRDLGFDFVGHAPPDYAGGRGDGSMKVLDEVCDAIFPQVYAWEHDDRGHQHHLDRVRALYAARGLLEKVSPVGCTYRPRTRGGKPVPAMADEARRVADDVVTFLRDPWVAETPAPSLYSLDAITFAGAGQLVVETVEAQRDTPVPSAPMVFGDTPSIPPIPEVLDMVSQ